MDIRYNSFFYTKGNAIKLRGTPEITQQQLEPGASVISNVFAHDDLEDAVTQTETGLFLSGNLIGVNGMNELGVCDFNGDGAADDFLATGATWWYRSGALGADSPWRYLYTSFKRRNQLILGYLNGDGICDVKDDKGIVYLGGVTVLPSSIPSQSIPNVKGNTLDEAESALTDAGYARGTVSYVVDSLCNNIGLVTKQSPAAGTSMAPGTLVNLSIGKEPTICP